MLYYLALLYTVRQVEGRIVSVLNYAPHHKDVSLSLVKHHTVKTFGGVEV
jgi:hypothetical protein